MGKYIFLQLFLLLICLAGVREVHGQVTFPNMSMTSGARNYLLGSEETEIMFRYSPKITSLSEEQLISYLNSLIRKQYDWLRVTRVYGNEITLHISENKTNTQRNCIIITQNDKRQLKIVQNPVPTITVFSVIGTQQKLPGTLSTVTLSGSQKGGSYRLYLDDKTIQTLEGTGEKLSFTGNFNAGTYTVSAFKGNSTKKMEGEASIGWYFVCGNISFPGEHPWEVPANGGVVEMDFILTGSNGNIRYWDELRNILVECNQGQIEGWNIEHLLVMQRVTSTRGTITIYVSPNTSSETRESKLNFLGSGIEIIQEPSGRVIAYDVVGMGNIIPGEQFSILLDGSQVMKYSLYRNDTVVSTIQSTEGPVIFPGNIKLGKYTVKGSFGKQTFAMNGVVDVKDVRQNPCSVLEKVTMETGETSETVVYYDGMGRPVQQIGIGASPAGKDVVKPIIYDTRGVVCREYLPYSITGTGAFRSNCVAEQNSFYTGLFGINPYAYADVKYGFYPDLKVVEESAPGEAWQMNATPKHTNKYYYGISENYGVKHFVLENNGEKLRQDDYWKGYSLTFSESSFDNKRTCEYRDFNNHVVCMQDQKNTTNYVYDEMGRLRYMLPPLQDSLFSKGVSKTLQELQNYCYYMEYDEHGRVYKEYKPGAGYTLYLYDKRGRQVLMQDALMRESGTWEFTKYDIYDRPVIIGRCTGQENAMKQGLASQTVFGEKRGTALHGYTNLTYPTSVNSNNCLTITYYDDYEWDGVSAIAFATGDALGTIKNNDVVGTITGSKEKVLGITGHQWLRSAIYYDEKYRIVQKVSELYPSGKEIVSNAYGFGNLVDRVKVKQTVGTLVTEYNKYFTYDHEGRQLKVEQEIAGDPNGKIVVFQHEYDEVGNVKREKLHGGIETREFAYNVGGMLTGVASPSFSFNLDYDQVVLPGGTPVYSGNANALRWKNADGVEKGYLYEYDNFGQLTSAFYKEKSGSAWVNPSNRYNVSGLSYDKHGNIRGLRRNDSGGQMLHDFDYKYGIANNGNAVKSITLSASDSVEFTYNANGNLIFDGRRGVSIMYNELNLPSKISKGTVNISYIYTASGKKLAQQVGGSLTYYRGVMVYNGSTLSSIIHPGGFVQKTSNGYAYYYMLKDHLGSTRVLLEASGKTLSAVQTIEYYPFGLAFSYGNLMKNKYLFSGKELQDASLGGEILNMYDFGSRFYDPIVARWFCQDPVTGFASPYGYCGNNPIIFIDPNGEFPWVIIPIVIGGALNVAANW